MASDAVMNLQDKHESIKIWYNFTDNKIIKKQLTTTCGSGKWIHRVHSSMEAASKAPAQEKYLQKESC